jgi:hypothetical protein
METCFQLDSEAKPAQLAARKWLQRFPFLTIGISLLASLFLPRGIYAQGNSPPQNDVDSGKVQPLDLKPGCWEVRTYTSTAIKESTVQPTAKPSTTKRLMTIVQPPPNPQSASRSREP